MFDAFDYMSEEEQEELIAEFEKMLDKSEKGDNKFKPGDKVRIKKGSMADNQYSQINSTKIGEVIKKAKGCEYYKVLYDDQHVMIAECDLNLEEPRRQQDQTLKTCRHDFVVVGHGPVSNDPWYNCKFCGIKKEDS